MNGAHQQPSSAFALLVRAVVASALSIPFPTHRGSSPGRNVVGDHPRGDVHVASIGRKQEATVLGGFARELPSVHVDVGPSKSV